MNLATHLSDKVSLVHFSQIHFLHIDLIQNRQNAFTTANERNEIINSSKMNFLKCYVIKGRSYHLDAWASDPLCKLASCWRWGHWDVARGHRGWTGARSGAGRVPRPRLRRSRGWRLVSRGWSSCWGRRSIGRPVSRFRGGWRHLPYQLKTKRKPKI